MNKIKDLTRPGGPLSNEGLFKELSKTQNAFFLELNNVSKPIQAKYENHINNIDGGLEYLINKQLLENRLLTPEMKQWKPYERKTNIDEKHYQKIKIKFPPEDPLEDSDYDPVAVDRFLKEIDLILNPPNREKLTYKKAEPLLKRLLDDNYSMTEEDDTIASNKRSFKGQRSKFMNKMKMKVHFKTAFQELLDKKNLSIDKFNLIINPPSRYYADILLTSFIMKCNRRDTDFNSRCRGLKVYIKKRRLSEDESKIVDFLVLI